MRNKSYFFRFAAIMMASLTCTLNANAYDMYLDGIYYTKLTNSTVEVSYANINSADYSGSVTVPLLAQQGIQSWTVRGIGYKAFGECSGLTDITLPTSLNYVGDLAFIRCTSLSGINIPENVTWIGNNAFEQCTSLLSVSLPSTLTSIESVAFTGCNNLRYVICEAHEPPTLGSNVFENSTYSNGYLLVPNSVAKEKYQAAPGWSNFASITAAEFYTFEKDGIYYCQTGPNTVAVCARDANYNSYSGNVTIPKSVVYDYHGYTVNEVASNAFRNCTNLTRVTLPETVGLIGNFAFANCPNLNQIVIPSNSMLTEIGNNAFVSTGLTSISLPVSLTKIGNYAFHGCDGLTTVTIPDNVTTVGASAFGSCSGLKTVTIGKNCTSLGEWCFLECTALQTVTCYAPTPPATSYYTFRNNDGFTTATLRMLYSSYDAYTSTAYWSNFTSISRLGYDFKYNNIYYRYTGNNTVGVSYGFPNSYTYSDAVTVPSQAINEGITYSVTSVCDNTYNGNPLTSVTLPSTIIRIESNAFRNCTGLTQITIPANVNYIGSLAFSGCTGLTKVNITNLANWCNILFANEDANPLKQAHVLTLNNSTVTSLTVPSSVTQIKQYAFLGCTSITSATLHNNVTSVGYGVFKNCTNLKTVNLGSGLTSIGGAAFNGCSDLTAITSLATTPPSLYSTTFDSSHYSNATLTVPWASKSAYLAANYWKNFTHWNTTYDFVVDGIYYLKTGSGKVGVTCRDAYGNCYSGDVTIPETVEYEGETYTVTTIDHNAFTYCPNLTSVTLPATIYSVNHAFFNNMAPNLTSITCLAIEPPTGMTEMTSDQYAGVTVTVPKNSVAAYQADSGWGQFANIVGMAYDFKRGDFFYEITGSNQAMLVRENSDSYKSMTSVTIPASVTLAGVDYSVKAIGDHAFYQCTNLQSVTFPSSVNSIGDYAFYKCTGLTGVLSLKEGLETIGSYAFAYCSGLTGAIFPFSVNSIGNGPFAYCTALLSFTRMNTHYVNPTYTINNGVVFAAKFGTLTKLVIFPGGKSQIYSVPNGIREIGAHAFRGSIVKTVTLPATLTTIGDYAFDHCASLTSMDVVKGVTAIGVNAFSFCTSMTSIVLPSTLTSLGVNAFNNDNALATVACKATMPPVCEVSGTGPRAQTPFDITHFTTVTLAVPKGYKTVYQVVEVWKRFTTIVERSSLLEVIPGDVNGDNAIDVSDVTTLISYILGNNPANFNAQAANLDGDDSIDVSDVTALISLVLSN